MRNIEIDGIRGWAALFVAIFHFYYELFHRLIPELDSIYYGFIFDGHIFVLVFFILSGDALSASFFSKQNLNGLTRLTVTRYFRLTFLIFVTCSLVYLCMKLNFQFNVEASQILHREDWLGSFINFLPSLASLIKYSLFDVYFGHTTEGSYNPFLWTMSVEMLGSMVVFINLYIYSRIRNPVYFLLAQLIFFWVFGSYMSLFILGMLLSYARSKDYFSAIRQHQLTYIGTLILLVFTIVLISFFGHPETLDLGVLKNRRIEYLLAFFLVIGCYFNSSLLAFFRNRLSIFLGHISFSLYAVQFVILISIASWLVVILTRNSALTTEASLFLSTGSVLLTVIVAYPLYRIEVKYLTYLKNLYTTFFMN